MSTSCMPGMAHPHSRRLRFLCDGRQFSQSAVARSLGRSGHVVRPSLWRFGPVVGQYSLLVSTTPITLTTVTPNQSAKGSTATLALAAQDSTTPRPSNCSARTIRFTMPRASLSTYSRSFRRLSTSQRPAGQLCHPGCRGDGSTAELPAALTVTAPGQANLQTNLILPGTMGRHVASTFYVEYSNTGNVAMPAPVLLLEATPPTDPTTLPDLPLFTLNPALQTSGYWTSAIPEGYSNTVQILACGKVPGVLEPGESVTVPVYYAGMQEPWSVSFRQACKIVSVRRP